jgi:hypothetical protein
MNSHKSARLPISISLYDAAIPVCLRCLNRLDKLVEAAGSLPHDKSKMTCYNGNIPVAERLI